MKSNKSIKTSYLFCCLLVFLCRNGFSQKLPNIQTEGVLIPSSLKIDGKLTEWDGLLKAHNGSTRIDYTIANDKANLYLAIKCSDKATIGKIMVGGISLIINNAQKKESGQAIMFPMPDKSTKFNLSSYLDSNNVRNLTLQSKEIKVLHLDGIKDSLISIYNDYNIKAAVNYESGILIYELIIPLKFVSLSLSQSNSFMYNIRLNGSEKSGAGPINASGSPNVPAPPPGLPAGRSASSMAGMSLEMRYPTYLSGKYILIKTD